MPKSRCPVCGSTKVNKSTPDRFKYENCGLSDVVLIGEDAVTITKCPDCEQTTTMIPQEQQLLQVIGLSLLDTQPGMSGEQLRYLRTLFEMSQADFAREMGKGRRETISEWERLDRIHSDADDELVLRLRLLDLYRRRVIESDHCFLADPHKERFLKMVETFVERGMKMLNSAQRRKKRPPVEVKRRKSMKQWEPELAVV